MTFKLKIIILICCLFICKPIHLFAQFDLEHWFSPIYLQNNHTINSITLHLSTPHETSFEVKIFDGNNIVIKTITLSKNTPTEYILPLSSMLLSSQQGMKVRNRSIHVAGENSFFASVRLNFDNGSNTDIISSKGKTAIGTLFYSANAPYNDYSRKNNINFQTSIIATKDNTHIKISGFSPKIIFSDASKYPDGITIILNKGESYALVSKKTDNFNNENPLDYTYWDSFIGSKIESDKPIAITNGNFNGVYYFEGNGKLLIDQSVPVKNIGTEYYIKKGFTDLNYEVEAGLVIATQNDTKIYLNGSSSPKYTLNEGKHQLLKSSDFAGDGMYIKSDKPVYFYQFIGGNNNSEKLIAYPFLTPAMGFVPPFNTTLPGKIDFISNVEKIDNISFDNIITVLTPKGSSLSVNDTPVTSDKGPYSFTGSNDWQYYSIKNLSGNLKLESNKSLITGIAGGFDIQKRSGSFLNYYTGFSNDPYLLVNGNCIQEEVILSLNNIDFEGFQWQLNNIDIPGANNSTFKPTVPGFYRCVLSYSGFSYNTTAVEVKNCPYTMNDIQLGKFCGELLHQLKFSVPNENENIDLAEIITNPLHGIAKIVNNQLSITLNTTFSGDDRVVVRLTNSSGVQEIQKIKYSIANSPIGDLKSEIEATAKINDETYTYDLSSAIISTNNETFDFYPTIEDLQANTNKITELKNYITKSNEVFVLVTNASGCTVTKRIILQKLPPDNGSDIDLTNIFTPNNDGINDTFDFSLLADSTNLILRIYDRQGEKIYEYQNDNKMYWDGKQTNNKPAPSGTYWVVYQYDSSTQGTIKKSKWLYLKRS